MLLKYSVLEIKNNSINTKKYIFFLKFVETCFNDINYFVSLSPTDINT